MTEQTAARWVTLINGGFTRIDSYGNGLPQETRGYWFSDPVGPAMALVIVHPQEEDELWVGCFPASWHDKVIAKVSPWCPKGQGEEACGLIAQVFQMMRDMADLIAQSLMT